MGDDLNAKTEKSTRHLRFECQSKGKAKNVGDIVFRSAHTEISGLAL